MSSGIKIPLPPTEDKWLAAAKFHNIISIHDYESNKSGSKITVPQFLSLKTIWKGYDANAFNTDKWPLRFGATAKELLEESTKLKRDNPEWREYLKFLGSTSRQRPNSDFSRNLGCFATVLQNQLEVFGLKEAVRDTEKVIVSPSPGPVAGRTRSKALDVESIPFSLQPSARSASVPRDHSTSPEREGRPLEAGKGTVPRASSDISETQSHVSVFSAINFEIPKTERDVTVDEQVVNTAAIAFLQSLFIHNGSRKAYWTAQRKGFCLQSEKGNSASFKALTDGHFKVVGHTRSAAILEVKARKRPQRDDFRIEMQESAQMALWIYEEPSSYWTPKDNPSICHRVLISQDHTEIFVTIAEYDKSYPGYLYKKVSFGDAGFLQMHRFGPFPIELKESMEKLAGILRVLLDYAATFEPQSRSPSPPEKTVASDKDPARPDTPDRGRPQRTSTASDPAGRTASRNITPVRQMQQLSLAGGPSSRASSQSRPAPSSQVPVGQAGIPQSTAVPTPGSGAIHESGGQGLQSGVMRGRGQGRGRGRGQGRGRGRGA